MIVILNNGTKINANRETVQIIFQNILKGDGAKQWQIQLNSLGNPLTGFNLSQVAAVVAEDDIVTDARDLMEKLDAFKDSLPNKDQSGKYWVDKFRDFLLTVGK